MRRYLKQALIGFCVAVALVAAGLYVLTHWRADTWTRYSPTSCRVELANGRVAVTWARTELFGAWLDRPIKGGWARGKTERPSWPDMEWTHQGRWLRPRSMHPPLGARVDWRNGEQAAGFSSSVVVERFLRRNHDGRSYPIYGYEAWLETRDRRILEIPLLLIALLAMLPIIASILRSLARRELPARTCMECGYDLRHSTDRCPECGRRFDDRKPLRVGLIVPVLAAAAVLLAVVIVLATLAADRGIIVSGVRTPAFNHSWPDEPRPRIRIIECALWVEDRTILLAETHDVTTTINIPVASLAGSATPPLTQMPLLEPTLRVIPDGDRNVHVLRLPIWMTLLLLLGGVATWINRVRRRGGFYLGRLNPDPSLPEAPAAP